MAGPRSKWDFRDVSIGLQMLRDFLLGRKHTLHGRFPPVIAPRTIPTPDIPRGPEYKYSKQYYSDRSVKNSVMPPVVAPIAEGPPMDQDPKMKVKAGGLKPDTLIFACAPTPGLSWWWDGHCFYEFKPEMTKQSTCHSTPAPSSSPECPQS